MRKDESREDYLETILILSKEKDFVRSIDIVKAMGFSKPSISVAVNKLNKENLISIDRSGHITLTEKGLEIAEKTHERHLKITRLLVNLGVSEEAAYIDAHKLQHDFSDETWTVIDRKIQHLV